MERAVGAFQTSVTVGHVYTVSPTTCCTYCCVQLLSPSQGYITKQTGPNLLSTTQKSTLLSLSSGWSLYPAFKCAQRDSGRRKTNQQEAHGLVLCSPVRFLLIDFMFFLLVKRSSLNRI
jgi:hypothetical protein